MGQMFPESLPCSRTGPTFFSVHVLTSGGFAHLLLTTQGHLFLNQWHGSSPAIVVQFARRLDFPKAVIKSEMPKGQWFQNATEGNEPFVGFSDEKGSSCSGSSSPFGNDLALATHAETLGTALVMLHDTVFPGLGTFRLCFLQASYTHFT